MMRSNAEQLKQRNRELSILNTIARALNSSVDLNETLRVALAQVADLLGLKTGWVWLLHEETGASYLAASQNLPPALTRNPEKMTGGCYCLRTYRDGDLAGAANVNVVECSRLQGLVDGTDGLRYHASIPLYAHGRKLGVMNVAGTDWRRLSADDLRLLYTIGDLVSIAIERARLFNRSTQIGALEERNRLARELHDTLAQGLTAISLQLESADALLEDSGDLRRAHDALHHALELTRMNLEEVRRSVLDLRAAPLEGRTLPEALADLAIQCGVPTTFILYGDERPLPLRVESGIYRIAQEALRNIERHAQATHTRLELTLTPDELHLLVEDDGIGFDMSAVEHGHFGLIGMSERAKLLGGRLKINSTPQSGTQIRVAVPI